MTVVAGIATLLNDDGVGVYSPDAPLPDGALPISIAGFPPLDGAALCVTTYAGGMEPDTRNGWEYPRLQVKVRDTDPNAALDLDRAAFAALQGRSANPLPGSSERLQDCYALSSEAQPLGRDDSGRWVFARNYQLSIEPA